MKAIEIMNELFSWAPGEYNPTCDTLKAGNPQAEVTKVAVCCFNTVQVVRDAAAWGAQLLITHEPTYYDHWDNIEHETPVSRAKRELIEKSGLTIYRYHDHPHRAPVDLICAGELKALGWEGAFEKTDSYGIYRYTPVQPITPRELAAHIERTLGIAHVRICGTMDEPCTRIITAFGACGGAFSELTKDSCEIMIAGEACEWQLGEYARDAALLGFKKALLILGHCGSERDGMRLTADLVAQKFPQLEVRYFESGEVYSYPER